MTFSISYSCLELQGAQHNVARVLLVAAVALEDGGAAVDFAVDGLAGGGAVFGNDHGQHAGVEAEHHAVDDGGGQEIEDQAVDDGVDVAENDAVGQDHGQRRAESQVARTAGAGA